MCRFLTIPLLLVLVSGLAQPADIGRRVEIPGDAAALHAKLAARVPPRLERWIHEQARKLRQEPTDDVRFLLSPNDEAISNMGLGDGDIEAIAFIVLMQATNDMDKDLKAIMAEVKAMTNAKQKLREMVNKVNQQAAEHAGRKATDPCLPPRCGGLQPSHAEATAALREARAQVALTHKEPATVGDLRAIAKDLKGKLDSMNEMSETASLRLQMMMERRSKFISGLSNIMKKISSTQDTLIQNLK